MNKRSTDDLILALGSDLQPTRPRSAWRGLAIVAVSTMVIVSGYIAATGFRPGLVQGHIDHFVFLSLGLFAVLAAICLATVNAMTSPSVGRSRNAWRGAAAAAAIIPLTALVMLLQDDPLTRYAARPALGLPCMVSIIAVATLVSLPLMMVLRAGAPSSPTRAAMIVGLAAGGAGAFAVSLHCSIDAPTHIGLWHAGAVALSAIIARAGAARFLRW